MRAAAAVLVDVLGKVREMREIGKRAHDVERRGNREVVEHRRQFGAHVLGFGGLGAAKPDRGLADRLDPGKRIRAGMDTQHVSQQAPEQAGVFLEGQVAVAGCVGHRSAV